jgi:hypothetical protein
MDAANAEDPRSVLVDGQPQPRELVFARNVYEWVRRLTPDASEELLLAARGHTLRRWAIPRDQYPQTTIGYHAWREALAQFHSQEAVAILQSLGYPRDKIERVRALITREKWPEDAEARVLEDADCLAFLEQKLAAYVDEWGEAKTIRILKRTMRKMTPQAVAEAARLSLGERERELLGKAAQPAAVRKEGKE